MKEYLLPGDPGYPTGGPAAAHGWAVPNPEYVAPDENNKVATYTKEQIDFATLFSATRGQIEGWNADNPWEGHDPAAINALMSGYLPNLQEAQIRVARGETLDQLKAWIKATE